MGDNEIKVEEQVAVTPPALSAEQIAEERKKNEAFAKASEGLSIDTTNATNTDTTSALQAGAEQVDQSEGQRAISQAYYDPLKTLGENISSLEEKLKAAKKQDEVAQRKERSMTMIGGISDGLASLANLIGVGGYGASHIDLKEATSLPALAKKFEEAQKERKADIKSIEERIEQAKKQGMEMKLQRGSALAAYQQSKENQAFQAGEAEKGRAFQEKISEISHTRDLEKLVQQQEFQKGMQESAQEFTAEQNRLERESREKIAKENNASDIMKTTIRYGDSGSKNLTRFVFNDPVSGNMRSIDLSDKSITNILSAYLPEAIKKGEITEDEAEEAKNWKSNEVSKTNLLGMVNKSKIMREALLAAVGEETESAPTPTTGSTTTPYSFHYSRSGYEPGWSVRYNK